MTSTDAPNVLLVLADQLAHDAMRHAGNPWARTPHLDRLARRSVRFTHACCTYPLCVPSRTSLLYGRHAHDVLLPHTDSDMAPQLHDRPRGVRPGLEPERIDRRLTRRGVRCAYAGKWHVGRWGPTESLTRHDPEGFEPLCGIDDHAVPDACAAYLDRPGEAPFLLVASFDNPHNIHEWAVGQPLPWGDLPEPPGLDELPPLPANFHASHDEPAAIEAVRRDSWRGPEPTPEAWRRYRWAYHRLIERLDAAVGRLLDALAASRHAERTWVVFTSDHGEMAGAHRMAFKRSLYDPSVRVPLLVQPPPGRLDHARVDDRLVSLGPDVYRLLQRLGGDHADPAAPAAPVDRHATPPLDPDAPDDPAATPRRDFVYAEQDLAHDRGVPARMIRTDTHKYVVYEIGRPREQLFDVAADPGEMVNLAGLASHADVLQAHRQRLRGVLSAAGVSFGGGHYAHPDPPIMLPGDAYPVGDGRDGGG
jgi:arylsulfatase A-like enzyme